MTEEEFWRVQRLDSNNGIRQKLTKHVNPLAEKILCACCNKKMRPSRKTIQKAAGPEVQLGYECRTKGCATKPKRIKVVKVYNAIEEQLKGFQIDELTFQQFLLGGQTASKRRAQQRAEKRRAITNKQRSAENEFSELQSQKAALVAAKEYDADARKHHEKRSREIKEELKNYRELLDSYSKDFDEHIQTFEELVELVQNAHQYWANANADQKAILEKLLVLNLIVENGRVQSVSWKKPFNRWIKPPEVASGGHGRT